jgi:hypothetical protein
LVTLAVTVGVAAADAVETVTVFCWLAALLLAVAVMLDAAEAAEAELVLAALAVVAADVCDGDAVTADVAAAGVVEAVTLLGWLVALLLVCDGDVVLAAVLAGVFSAEATAAWAALAGAFAWACASAMPGSNPIVTSEARRKATSARKANRIKRAPAARAARRVVQESTKLMCWNPKRGCRCFPIFSRNVRSFTGIRAAPARSFKP